jgi:hypothetical protein
LAVTAASVSYLSHQVRVGQGNHRIQAWKSCRPSKNITVTAIQGHVGYVDGILIVQFGILEPQGTGHAACFGVFGAIDVPIVGPSFRYQIKKALMGET